MKAKSQIMMINRTNKWVKQKTVPKGKLNENLNFLSSVHGM